MKRIDFGVQRAILKYHECLIQTINIAKNLCLKKRLFFIDFPMDDVRRKLM